MTKTVKASVEQAGELATEIRNRCELVEDTAAEYSDLTNGQDDKVLRYEIWDALGEVLAKIADLEKVRATIEVRSRSDRPS